MILRTVILLVILGALGFQLDREQRDGRFQQADDLFLDFLLANARDRFVVDPAQHTDQVVLVRMREEDKAEYGAWPPPPIDWQMILKGLVPFEPAVIVIATPLTWGQPPPDFVADVGGALLPFTSVVLGVEARVEMGATRMASAVEPDAIALDGAFPNITRIEGDPALLPRISRITAQPDEIIRRQMELGFTTPPTTSANEPFAMPLAFRHGGIIAPSLMLQALSHYVRAPYSAQRLRIGPGAGAHLGRGIYLPLSDSGQLVFKAQPDLKAVNALNFMTGDLADGLSAADKENLGRDKIIVVGIDHDTAQPTSARVHAAALAHALSLPRVHAIGLVPRWLICGIAAVGGCLLLRHRGGKAMRAGLILIFAALVISYLTFQSQLVWFPPTVPAAILAASTLFAMVFGVKRAAGDRTAASVGRIG